MPRHRRFENHRYLGDKRTFVAYDCDDDDQFAVIEAVPLESIASFAPDEPYEFRNRGYRALYKERLRRIAHDEQIS